MVDRNCTIFISCRGVLHGSGGGWQEINKKGDPIMENRCVCCGVVIPEGRLVCPKCEKEANILNTEDKEEENENSQQRN